MSSHLTAKGLKKLPSWKDMKRGFFFPYPKYQNNSPGQTGALLARSPPPPLSPPGGAPGAPCRRSSCRTSFSARRTRPSGGGCWCLRWKRWGARDPAPRLQPGREHRARVGEGLGRRGARGRLSSRSHRLPEGTAHPERFPRTRWLSVLTVTPCGVWEGRREPGRVCPKNRTAESLPCPWFRDESWRSLSFHWRSKQAASLPSLCSLGAAVSLRF